MSKQWMIQQHCCLAAVFDVDVDPFQKKKKKIQTQSTKVVIMIEETSRRMECTLLTPDYSQMPTVAPHLFRDQMLNSKALFANRSNFK